MIASIGFQLGLIEVIKNVQFTGGPAASRRQFPPSWCAITARPRSMWCCHVAIAAARGPAVAWLVRRLWSRDQRRCETTRWLSRRSDATPYGSRSGSSRLRSAIAGLAGAIYAHYFRFVAPEQFEVPQSVCDHPTMVVVGGMRTIWGPVIGAILLQILPQAITFLNLPPCILGRCRASCSPGWCFSSCFSGRAG